MQDDISILFYYMEIVVKAIICSYGAATIEGKRNRELNIRN